MLDARRFAVHQAFQSTDLLGPPATRTKRANGYALKIPSVKCADAASHQNATEETDKFAMAPRAPMGPERRVKP